MGIYRGPGGSGDATNEHGNLISLLRREPRGQRHRSYAAQRNRTKYQL